MAEISCDLVSLDEITEGINSNTYQDKEINIRDGVTSINLKSQPDQYTINREIKKCFKSIIGSVQDYLDRLIATKNLFEETKTINARSLDEFKKALKKVIGQNC